MATTRPDTAARRRAWRRGRTAERLCVAWLWLKGWRVLQRNRTHARGSGFGEVDIVARRGRILAFIEVKARPEVEEALQAVTATQRDRIARMARLYLARPGLEDLRVRFDVMAVRPWRLPLHLPDAWRPEGM